MKTIGTKKDYAIALKKFQSLFHSKKGTSEEKEAKHLALLIEDYENKHVHIPEPNIIEDAKKMKKEKI